MTMPAAGDAFGVHADLRPMVEADRNFILSSWLRSYSEGTEFRGMKPSSYYLLYDPHVKAMLSRSVVTVATLPEATDVVLGWMAVEGDLLHYVLVKPRWRKLGLARFMLRELTEQKLRWTHVCPIVVHIPDAWSYDPDARFPKGDR